MDGWESRRKREPGHDWCIVKLGMRGRIHGIDIDTNHFLGNHPPEASLEAADGADGDWREVLAKSHLNPGSQNQFELDCDQVFDRVRLNIFPDGGVARLRVYGVVAPDWEQLATLESLDLIAVEHGGVVLGCNDMFFSSKDNLIMPGRGVNMGDGWETKRRRSPGHDWVIVKLGKPGFVDEFEIDTHHFKGNYPDRCSIEGVFAPERGLEDLQQSDWQELLAETKLSAHHQHHTAPTNTDVKVSHLRMNIFPDGGVSRLRARGRLA